MTILISVIAPVFLLLGFGALSVWRGWIAGDAVDHVMDFTQKFAIPCLLFSAIATLDLGAYFEPRLLISFYTGALSGFVVGLLGARFLFGRPWDHAVAIGFVGLFSNSVLLGLPIMERAYGPDALSGNFAIIAIHAPFCYLVGITTMEIVRNAGSSALDVARKTGRSMFRNALVIALGLGFMVNLSGITPPEPFLAAVNLLARAALPAALFCLGGILVTYKPEGDLRLVGFIVLVSVVLHPAVTFGLGQSLALTDDALKSAVITGAMAPGINAYIFANMYGVAKRVAATAVLVGTAANMLTAWAWLTILT